MRRLHRLMAIGASAVAAGGAAVAGAAPAAACGTGIGTPPKYLALADWQLSPSNLGARAAFNVSYAFENASGNHWIAQTLWEATNSAIQAGQTYWIEAGWTYGFDSKPGYFWYWADRRPNGLGYHEHQVPISISVGDSSKVQIQYTSNNTWSIGFSATQGSYQGYSTSNPPHSAGMAVGLENSAHDNPTLAEMRFPQIYALAYLPSGSSSWTYGWSGALTECDVPVTGHWNSFPNEWDSSMH